jgi:hypothetical protein
MSKEQSGLIHVGILCESHEGFIEVSAALDPTIYDPVHIKEAPAPSSYGKGTEAISTTAVQASKYFDIPVYCSARNPNTEPPSAVLCDTFGRVITQRQDGDASIFQCVDANLLIGVLKWRRDRIVYITGPHAAGKTEVAGVLEEGGLCQHIDLGPTIRKLHTATEGSGSFLDWLMQGEQTEGADFSDKLLAKAVLDTRADVSRPLGFAVVGSRSVNGLKYIDDALGPSTSLHIHVTADDELLHRRYCEREGTDLTSSEFGKLITKDAELGLEELAVVADDTIRNNGDKNSLASDVALIVGKWLFKLPSDDLSYIG